MLEKLTSPPQAPVSSPRERHRPRREVALILRDPVGREALDRLLITPETVAEHPELKKSLAAYIALDGRRARIDLTQARPILGGRHGPG